MLTCCNQYFYGSYTKVVADNSYYYRKIEFGVCPNCGGLKFRDYIQYSDGRECIKDLSGEKAKNQIEKWRKTIEESNKGSKGNQNVYYGDFQKTGRKDENGLPVYYQLRKNFNNQSEIIGEIKTVVYSSH